MKKDNNKKNKPKDKKAPITIRDVAKLAGVSPTTISHALSGERYVKEETRQKILKIIKDNKYKPNIIARSLSKKTSKTIGVILPDINDAVYTKILKGIEDITTKDDYVLIINSTYFDNDIEVNQIERLNSLFVDGFLLIGGTKDIRHIIKANIRDLPIVLVNRWVKDAKYPKVLVDNRKAITEAVNYLVSLGHKKLGYLGWIDDSSINSVDKYEGFLEGLEKNKIKKDEKKIFLKKGVMKDGYREAYDMVNDYLGSGKKIDMSAVICKNDYIALGAMEAFKKNNIDIPDDLSIMGFGNFSLSEHSTPKLSTIDIPLEQMGNSAAEILLGSINKKKIRNETVLFDTVILQRESTREPGVSL